MSEERNIIEKANELVDKYKDELAACGVKISVSKKYFESEVNIRHNTRSAIIGSIERNMDARAEKKKGYNYQKNRYKYLVLAVLPTDKELVPREWCSEYSFLLWKIDRAHVGDDPREVIREDSAVLAKVEKRLEKILKEAKKSGAAKTCRDTFWDTFRYTDSPKYEYRERFCGQDRYDWSSRHILIIGGVSLGLVFLLWLFSKIFA